MATPASVPRRRVRRDRDSPEPRTRNCPHFDCSRKLARDRYACDRHWRQLPKELQAVIKANFPTGTRELSDDHPFRVAARAARTAWREAE